MKINNLEINWTGHSGFVIKSGSKVIYIDPFQLSSDKPKADIILLTHSHYDHCSVKDIKKISREGCVIIMPADCQSKVSKLDHGVESKILHAGEQVVFDGINIKAVPSYNTDKQFHPKEHEWNGYVIETDGVKIYHAGDTDLIPEMKNLANENLDVAFLPVGGTYTMDSEQASKAAEIIGAKLNIPMHYASIVGIEQDALKFIKLCAEKGLKAEILTKSDA